MTGQKAGGKLQSLREVELNIENNMMYDIRVIRVFLGDRGEEARID